MASSSVGPDDVDDAGGVSEAEGLEGVTASFDPARLVLARERSGLTQASLAELLDIPAETVTRVERRYARPSAATLLQAATALEVPVAYFAAGRPMVRIEVAHFRSVRSALPVERDQARAVMSHLAELVRLVEQAVRLPRLRLPDVPPDPAEAAALVRQAWRLPDGPVHHLIRLLESKGVVVSMTSFQASERVDAFSCRPPGMARPLICLSRERGHVLRRRFSAAHELGHLLLHRHAVPGSAEHEEQADRFAAEFLSPADQIVEALPDRLDIAGLLDVQQRWGLSLRSLLRRSRDLDVLDDRAYRTGKVALARLGWHRNEPVRPPEPESRFSGEWPSMLSDAVQLASLHGLTEEALATDLRLHLAELEELLSRGPCGRPRLRLVSAPHDEPF